MNKTEFTILSNDRKTPLHAVTWEPEGRPCCVVQLIHGMSEHIDRYHDFASFLADNGYAVIGHDHLGHGRSVSSEDDLGFFSAKSKKLAVIEDIRLIHREARNRFPGLPVFMLGHSMGSFMLRYYMAAYPEDADGVIILGTGDIPSALAGFGTMAAKSISSLKGDHYRSAFLTQLAVGGNNKKFSPARTEFDWLSTNEENVDRYIADDRCGFPFTAGAYRDFFSVIKDVADHKNFDRIPRTLPIFIASGEEDPVGGRTACTRVKADYERIGMTDVTLKLYPGDRHEILNETDRGTVYKDIFDWIEEKRG